MIHRFSTIEEAAIYAGVMRQEGHFAEILDGCMGTLWGPLAIGGIRVIVTDAPAVEDVELPDPEAGGPTVLDFIRMLVVAFVGVGVLTLVGTLLSATEPGVETAALVVDALPVVCLPVLFVLIAPLMIPFTGALRDESSVGGNIVKWLILVGYGFGYVVSMLVVLAHILGGVFGLRLLDWFF